MTWFCFQNIDTVHGLSTISYINFFGVCIEQHRCKSIRLGYASLIYLYHIVYLWIVYGWTRAFTSNHCFGHLLFCTLLWTLVSLYIALEKKGGKEWGMRRRASKIPLHKISHN